MTLILEPADKALSAADFGAMIAARLRGWRAAKKRGVWLKLPAAAAHLVAETVRLGFTYHHARPEYLMMTAWLGAGPSARAALLAPAHHCAERRPTNL